MTRDPWPWPVDTALHRARRVARSYRDVLETVDPTACAYLDAEMTRLGQRWILPMATVYSDDDWLTAQLVADHAGVAPKTVYEWKRRGLAPARTREGLRWRFADVRAWLGRGRG